MEVEWKLYDMKRFVFIEICIKYGMNLVEFFIVIYCKKNEFNVWEKKMLLVLYYYVYCVLKKIMFIYEKNNCGVINYFWLNNFYIVYYIVMMVDLYILFYVYDICKLVFIYL